MPLLVGKNLSLGYENKEVVNRINFEVKEGDYLCIVGENGAGKSTLMKTMLGLVEPLSGDLIFEDGLKKNEIGYLPQQTFIQKDFPASVEEIVLSGCQGRMGIRPFYNKAEKELARMNMEKLDILNLSKRCYRELSGGQQQRVLLARALCATKKVLLLDEPVAGLDPNAMDNFYGILKKLNDEKITIIMVTHDVSKALQYALHVLLVSENSFFGTKDEFVTLEQELMLKRNLKKGEE